jgi:hypothetical protein
MNFRYSRSYLARIGSRDYMTERVKQQFGGQWRNIFFGKHEGKINLLKHFSKIVGGMRPYGR